MADTTAPVSEDLYKHKEGTFQRLASGNYATWSQNCHRLLLSLGVWDIVDNNEARPEDPSETPFIRPSASMRKGSPNLTVDTIRRPMSSTIQSPPISAHTSTRHTILPKCGLSSSNAQAIQRAAPHICFQQMASKPGVPRPDYQWCCVVGGTATRPSAMPLNRATTRRRLRRAIARWHHLPPRRLPPCAWRDWESNPPAGASLREKAGTPQPGRYSITGRPGSRIDSSPDARTAGDRRRFWSARREQWSGSFERWLVLSRRRR